MPELLDQIKAWVTYLGISWLPAWVIAVVIILGPFLYRLLLIAFQKWLSSPGEMNKEIENAFELLEEKEPLKQLRALNKLEEMMAKSKKNHQQILPLLVGYLRENSKAIYEDGRTVEFRRLSFERHISTNCKWSGLPDDQHKRAQVIQKLKYDTPLDVIQNILNVIAKRNVKYDKKGFILDFSGTNLSSLSFYRGCFNNADFGGAILQKADLSGCSLKNTSFQNAIIDNAECAQAVFINTDFMGVRAYNTHFDQADLSNCHFPYATLYSASMQKVKAKNADFSQANMWRCWCGLSNFKNAKFHWSIVDACDFKHSKNLTRGQFKSIKSSNQTKFPWDISN